ncbi:MAG TPA: hypothetical protein VJT78_14425 [Candidatus Dormibacteraeota bacterium]|nr:hypothetical protein [Candidatus Dormibacteraeota bacterium]
MGVKGWTIVYRGQRIRTEMVSAMLSARGLTTEVFGDNGYGVGMDFSDARLMVPDDQAAEALNAIQEAESLPPDEDDSDA